MIEEKSVIRGMNDLGRNGAALAALGDIAAGFLPVLASFGVRKEGVKLGESTLKVFFVMLLLDLKVNSTRHMKWAHGFEVAYLSVFWPELDLPVP